MREEVVDLTRQLQRIDDFVRAQMSDLSGCMDARIGASRAPEIDFAENLPGGPEQVSLHRLLRVTLRLPPGVAGSFVLDREPVSRHAPRVVSDHW